jgi:hypothetical protein
MECERLDRKRVEKSGGSVFGRGAESDQMCAYLLDLIRQNYEQME